MPLRKLQPLTFRPAGLSDALDATNAFPGAMAQLADLVPMPGTMGVYTPRSASLALTTFSSFNTPGVISALVVIGTRVYGMIASQRFPGYDEPFCYDVKSNVFVTISGVNANNVPLTPLSTGDWTPPTIAAPASSRILVTHPGFRGAGPLMPFFGWFDISNFKSTSLLGNTTNGSNVISSINDGFTSAPIADGVQPGQLITGPGIPANTTVTSVANGVFDISTTGTTNGTTALTGVVNLAGVLPGMGISGPQIAAGTTVVSIAGTTVTMSLAALGSAAGTTINFSGGGTITLSAAATATASQIALSISGGTFSNPLWGAGNTNTNPLSAPPTAVGAYSGRAWYAVGNATVFSDSLNPTQVTNASQALILGDNTSVTAFSPLPFENQVTGGMVQALIAFKGAGTIYQITGDAATSNLTLAAVAGSVGTIAPNSICSTPLGIAFIAVDGLRFLSLTGVPGPPVGVYGEGVNVPFLNALYPTRINAEFNQNFLRISYQDGITAGNPWREVCYDIKTNKWCGPHSFPQALNGAYTENDRVGFIFASPTIPAALWFHSMVPTLYDQFVENGVQMAWSYQTSLLPDNNRLAMNRMLDTTVGMILPAFISVNVSFSDESGAVLNEVSVLNPTPANAPQWGSATWGQFVWGSIASYFIQYRVPWTVPLIFKQGTVKVTGVSQPGQAIGNLYMGIQPLGYMLEDQSAIVGYTGLEASTAFTGLAAVLNTDGSYTTLMASLAKQQSGYP